ncbi:hypothetical protein ACQ4LE_001965 [Meloidogyne hapla]
MSVIKVSQSEYSKHEFLLTYDVVRDVYTRPNNPEQDKAKGFATWINLNKDVQRNVETDHKMSYICRQSGKENGQIGWRFEHPGQNVASIEVQLTGMTTFSPKATITATVKSGKRQENIPVQSGRVKVEKIGPSDFTEIIVQMTGGTDKYNEWQHSQLFRTSNDKPNAENMLVKIKFAETSFFSLITNPKIPAKIDFMQQGFGKGFMPPKRIIIVGTPLAQAKRFDINMVEDGEIYQDANVPFHFNPRFADQIVVRNNWTKTKGWQTEERDGAFPFKIGEPFILEFIADTGNKIICNINNKHFNTFSREDLSKVSKLEITEAIQVSSITLCNALQM